jgi:hypothetical protein
MKFMSRLIVIDEDSNLVRGETCPAETWLACPACHYVNFENYIYCECGLPLTEN